jgi:Holliday junction resolvasome RuvABC DNA-binding subunit
LTLKIKSYVQNAARRLQIGPQISAKHSFRISADELTTAIIIGKILNTILFGYRQKTAERMVLELKDKVPKVHVRRTRNRTAPAENFDVPFCVVKFGLKTSGI